MIAILRVVAHALSTKDDEQFFRVHPRGGLHDDRTGTPPSLKGTARAQLAQDAVVQSGSSASIRRVPFPGFAECMNRSDERLSRLQLAFVFGRAD
jgi:hypothetical protein